jgi:hypothetical protein
MFVSVSLRLLYLIFQQVLGLVLLLMRPPDVMEHPFRSKWSGRSGGKEAAVPE